MSETYTPPPASPPPPPPPPPASGAKGGAPVPSPQPPKDPVLIAILNLLVLGCVGYFLMNQKMKGIVAVVAWILGLGTCGIVSLIVCVVAAIDGYQQAQQQQAGFTLGEWTFFKDHL